MKACPKCGASSYDTAAFCHSCGADLSGADAKAAGAADPLAGRTLADKYLLLERIGEGGMGAVYKAEHTVLEKTIAVKILHREFLADDKAVQRFRHEARAASRMNHPNSISVIDFGETPDGLFYLVTEFLRGEPLAAHLDQHGAVELRLTMEVMRQTLAAMEEAEGLGIVHRDLKPENIFVEKLVDGSWLVKVLDFGIAKRVDQTASVAGLTTPGMVCGTPEYMAPEQARGEPVDHRADIYSLGVIWYEMLTGVNPFDRGSVAETLLAHMQQEPRSPSVVAPERRLPESLDNLVLWALAKKREDRYENMAAFRKAVEAWCSVNLSVEEEGVFGASAVRSSPAEEPSPPPSPVELPAAQKAPVPEPTADLFAFAPKPVPAAAVPVRAKKAKRGSMATDETLAAVELEAPLPGLVSGSLVGREQQLRASEEAVRRGGLIGLTGEPGIGKSAILQSLIGKAGDWGYRVIVVDLEGPGSGRCLAGPRRALTALLDLDETELTLEALVRAMERFSIHEQEKIGLSDLLDVADPTREPLRTAARARERIASFQAAVLACSRRSPLLLAVEDVDRMDRSSRALFTGLSASLAQPRSGHPAAVVVTSAAASDDVPSSGVNIHLDALSGKHTRDLADLWSSILRARGLTDAHLSQAGGNPFFVEQMARMAAEGGPSQTLTRRMDLVDMRLERVSGIQRQILQMAAVRADSFGPDAMARDLLELKEIIRTEAAGAAFQARALPSTDEIPGGNEVPEFKKTRSQVAEDLSALRKSGFVRYDAESWTLSHRIFQQSIEAGMPAEVRRQHHLVYLRRREAALHKGSKAASAVWVARHAVEALSERSAVEALQAAGCEAMWNDDPEAAVRHLYGAFDRIRRLWAAGGVGEPGLTDGMVALARQLGSAMSASGQGETASFLFQEIQGLLAEDEPHLKAALLLDIGRLSMERGRVEAALAELERALQQVRLTDARWLTAQVMSQLAQVRARKGDLHEAVQTLEEAIRITGRGPASDGEHVWRFSQMIGQLYAAWGKPDEALEVYEKGLEAARSSRSFFGQIELAEALARHLKQVRRPRDAAAHLERAVAAAVEWGDRSRAAEICCLAGEVAAEIGDRSRARAFFDRAFGYAASAEHTKCADRARAGIARLGG